MCVIDRGRAVHPARPRPAPRRDRRARPHPRRPRPRGRRAPAPRRMALGSHRHPRPAARRRHHPPPPHRYAHHRATRRHRRTPPDRPHPGCTGAASRRRPRRPARRHWAPVIADIARHHANRTTPQRGRRELDAHSDDRLPRAALRRHIQIRDRTCVGVGCRHRPSHCDQDHTVAYQHGGRTVAADLGPLCRHDHTLKTDGGWTLVQPSPGSFVWTTPLRGRYTVQPEPVLPPLREPCPAPRRPRPRRFRARVRGVPGDLEARSTTITPDHTRTRTRRP